MVAYQIKGKTAPYNGKEDNMQKAVARYLKSAYPGLLWFHTPNGGSRNYLEAVKLKAMGVLPGVSDVIILEPRNEFKGLVIELKTKRGTLQKTQEDFLTAATKRGFKCVVCYNVESVIETVKDYFK